MTYVRYCAHWLGARLSGRAPLEFWDFRARLRYPDVRKAGLSALLQGSLDKLDPDLGTVQACDPDGWWQSAGIKRGGRRARVHCAWTERAFLLQLRAEGTTENLHGLTGELRDVAAAIADWLTEEPLGFEAMADKFSFLENDLFARAYERGEAIEYLWRQLLHEPTFDSLGPLIEAAAAEPRLRRLRPYTAYDRLCFSRWVDYPFSHDLPRALPHGERFRVLSPDDDVLGEGDAAETVAVLVASLPEPLEVFKRGPVYRVRSVDRESTDARSDIVYAVVDRSRPDAPHLTHSTYEEAEAELGVYYRAGDLSFAEQLTVVELERTFPERR